MRKRCSTLAGKDAVDNYLQVIIAQTSVPANQNNATDFLRRRMDASVLVNKGRRRWLERFRTIEASEFATTNRERAAEDMEYRHSCTEQSWRFYWSGWGIVRHGNSP
jgi:hypothetical protein